MATFQSLFFNVSRGYREYIYADDGTIESSGNTLFQLDGIIEEKHSQRVKITRHPVEYGANITDHIIKQPSKVVITGVVTNSPQAKQLLKVMPGGATAGSQALSALTGARAREAYVGLLEVQAKCKPLQLQTGFKTYNRMILSEISAPSNSEGWLKVTLTFEEIFVLNSSSSITTARLETSTVTDVDWATAAVGLTSLGIAGSTFAGFEGFELI